MTMRMTHHKRNTNMEYEIIYDDCCCAQDRKLATNTDRKARMRSEMMVNRWTVGQSRTRENKSKA